MPRRLICFGFALLAMAFSPLRALADDVPVYDARLEGYNKVVTLTGGSEALLWLLLIALGILALSVLFKDAKRTHLD